MDVAEIKANYPAYLTHNGVTEPTVVSRPILRAIPAPVSALGVHYEITGYEERCGHPRAKLDTKIWSDAAGATLATNTCGLCSKTTTHHLAGS